MFLVDFLEQRNVLPVVHKVCAKDNANARQIRMNGNTIFTVGENIFLALEKYNESICMSVYGSEDLGIAFANRSAVYLELGKPELCLKDIDNNNNLYQNWRHVKSNAMN